MNNKPIEKIDVEIQAGDIITSSHLNVKLLAEKINEIIDVMNAMREIPDDPDMMSIERITEINKVLRGEPTHNEKKDFQDLKDKNLSEGTSYSQLLRNTKNTQNL